MASPYVGSTMIKHFTVWSKDNCAYCTRAKELITLKGYAYEEKKVTQGGYTMEQLLETVPYARTFPQILVNGELIGGYEHLVTWFQTND